MSAFYPRHECDYFLMDSEKTLIPNSSQAIAAAWDRLCDTYIQDLADLNKRKALAAVELAVIRKELGSRKGLHILDAGCGPGWHGLELARDGHQLVMTDLSSRMLKKVRAAAENASVQDRVTICQADIRSLTLQPNSFDAIISCGTVVSDCGDPDAALREFSSLLKDSGIVVFSVRNLWASLDSQCRNSNSDDIRQWIESGRRLVPQGHEAFDWTFFTVQGLRDACSAAQMQLQRVYPVGAVTPTQDDTDIPSYVQLHIERVDEDGALTGAHELFAVAKRPLR